MTTKCMWADYTNDADPEVEGVSGDFDKYLCPYHDEVAINEKLRDVAPSGLAGVQNDGN